MKNRSGFALIELMVVVAVLSVAAAVFVPRFLKHQIQRRQEVCLKNLQSLYEAEKVYYQKNQAFTTDLSLLGWSPQGNGAHQYRFLTPPSPQSRKAGFIFECRGNIDKDPTIDQAQIDEMGQVSKVIDDTKN